MLIAVIIITTVIISLTYITFMILYLKNKVMENNSCLNSELKKMMDEEFRNAERLQKQQCGDYRTGYDQLIKTISDNTESLLSKINFSSMEIDTSIKSNSDQNKEIIKLIKQVKDDNQRQEEILKNMILSYQRQEKTTENMAVSYQKQEKTTENIVNKLLSSNEIFSDKIDLVYKDFELMLEMLKAAWMNDLIKDMENCMK